MAFKRAVSQSIQWAHQCQPYQMQIFRLQIYINLILLYRQSVLATTCTAKTQDSLQYSLINIFDDYVTLLLNKKMDSYDNDKIVLHMFVETPLWNACFISVNMWEVLSYRRCTFYSFVYIYVSYLIVIFEWSVPSRSSKNWTVSNLFLIILIFKAVPKLIKSYWSRWFHNSYFVQYLYIHVLLYIWGMNGGEV